MLFLAVQNGYTLDDIFRWVQTEAEATVTEQLAELGNARAIRAWQVHVGTHKKTKSSISATAYTILEG